MTVVAEESTLSAVYGLVDPRYSRPFSRYPRTTEFDELVRAHGLEPEAGPAIYTFATPLGAEPNETEGWKLHVSAHRNNAQQILSIVAELCHSLKIKFKYVKDSRLLDAVNSKSWPRESASKFITIYPPQKHVEAATKKFANALQGIDGPRVHSDRRVSGTRILWARYGAIEAAHHLNEDGRRVAQIRESGNSSMVEDVRKRTVFKVAPNREIYFGPNDRFRAESAMKIDSSGGTFRVFDEETEMPAIARLGYRDGERDHAGRDSSWRIANEMQILEHIAPQNISPKPIWSRASTEYSVLVEELVPGATLSGFVAKENPLLKVARTHQDCDKYARNVFAIWSKLVHAFQVLDDCEIGYTDVSSSNVIVNIEDSATGYPRANLALIDFESAWQGLVSEHPRLEHRTPGYHVKNARSNKSSTVDFIDVSSVSLLIASTIFPVNPLAELDLNAFLRYLRRAMDTLVGDTDVVSVIEAGIRRECSLSDLGREIVSTHFSDLHAPQTVNPRSSGRAIQLRTSTRTKPTIESTQVSRDAEEPWSHIARLIRPLTNAAEKRDWSLSPHAFERNDVCVAWGESGVVYALSKAGYLDDQTRVRFRQRAISRELSLPPGLYVGQAGIAWTLGECGYIDEAFSMLQDAFNARGTIGTNLWSGVSGVGLTALHLASRTNSSTALQMAETIAELVTQSIDDLKPGNGPGLAFGSSGPAYFLATAASWLNCRRYLDVAENLMKESVASSIAVDNDARSVTHQRGTAMVHTPYWNVGTAGLLRALYAVEHESGTRIIEPIEVSKLERDLFREHAIFPGLERGLAGVGDGALDVWQRRGSGESLAWAKEAARTIHSLAVESATETGDTLEVPGNHLTRLVHDFSFGNAGVILFMSRLQRICLGESAASTNFTVPGKGQEVKR